MRKGRKKLTEEEHLESARKRLEKHSKINEGTGCLEWTGSLRSGYGAVQFKGKMWRAHRLSFFLAGNELIPGLEICHNCNNRLCIRPEHLRQDTRSSNQIDRSKAGNNPMRKLSDEQVLEIRKLYIPWSREFGTTKLGEKFGVDASAIRAIITGKTLSHVQ